MNSLCILKRNRSEGCVSRVGRNDKLVEANTRSEACATNISRPVAMSTPVSLTRSFFSPPRSASIAVHLRVNRVQSKDQEINTRDASLVPMKKECFHLPLLSSSGSSARPISVHITRFMATFLYSLQESCQSAGYFWTSDISTSLFIFTFSYFFLGSNGDTTCSDAILSSLCKDSFRSGNAGPELCC